MHHVTSILFVIDNINYGGGERVFEELINGLDPARFALHVACLPAGKFVERIRGKAKVIPLDLRSLIDPRKPFEIARIIRNAGIDVVHSQGARADFYCRMAVALSRPAKIVTTIAAPVEEFNVSAARKRGYVLLDRFSERYVDAFIAVSASIEKRLRETHKVPGGKITVISNGIDPERYAFDQDRRERVRSSLGIQPGTPVVGTAGRLVWVKGHTYLLEAVRIILRSSSHSPVFLIAGEGEDRASLERRAAELGIAKNVIFAGFREDMRGLLSACDIFTLPSLREGQPLVLLEAMAAGRPAVVTDIDGIREVISDGETGILVQPRDPAALADAITALLHDGGRRERLGAAASAAVRERFSLKKTIDRHAGLYATLSGGKRNA